MVSYGDLVPLYHNSFNEWTVIDLRKFLCVFFLPGVIFERSVECIGCAKTWTEARRESELAASPRPLLFIRFLFFDFGPGPRFSKSHL